MRVVPILGLLAFVAGCSSSSSDAQQQPTTTTPSLCATDSRAQTYSAGMEQMGTGGAVGVKLTNIDPNPVYKGDNDWTISVVDASGAPVTAATIKVTPFMPDHGHGSSIVPTVTEQSGGSYDVNHVNLFMPGIWQITFDVTTAAGVHDASVFTFCVND
ncbi:MAG TPA: FixH family protein [Polyangiaceae bacterium]